MYNHKLEIILESDNDDDDVEVVVRAVNNKTKCSRTVKIKGRKKKMSIFIMKLIIMMQGL